MRAVLADTRGAGISGSGRSFREMLPRDLPLRAPGEDFALLTDVDPPAADDLASAGLRAELRLLSEAACGGVFLVARLGLDFCGLDFLSFSRVVLAPERLLVTLDLSLADFLALGRALGLDLLAAAFSLVPFSRALRLAFRARRR